MSKKKVRKPRNSKGTTPLYVYVAPETKKWLQKAARTHDRYKSQSLLADRLLTYARKTGLQNSKLL